MMISLLVFSLLAAEPAPSPRAAPAPLGVLAVGVTSPPELDKVASEVGRPLGRHRTAPTVEWTGYLKSRAEGCARELRCLLGAPGLQSATRLLHLRLRPLGGGRLPPAVRLLPLRGPPVSRRGAARRGLAARRRAEPQGARAAGRGGGNRGTRRLERSRLHPAAHPRGFECGQVPLQSLRDPAPGSIGDSRT